MATQVGVVFSTGRDVYIKGTKYVSDITRSWVWNDVGTASFLVPRSLPGFTEVIKYGNIVRIYEEGLPTWVGVVVGHSFSMGGCTLNLNSAEWLLTRYFTDQGLRLGADNGGLPAGQIAKILFENATTNGWTSLKLGTTNVDIKHFKEYDYAELFASIRDLAEEDKAAFWVDADLKFHYVKERGTTQQNFILVENVDLVDCSTDGTVEDLVTNGLALGEGNELIDRPKKLLQIPNANIFSAAVFEYDAVIDQQGLVGPLTEDLRKLSTEVVTVDCNVVNRNGNWARIAMGNTVTIGVWKEMYTTFQAKVIGIELGTNEAMRVVLEMLPTNQATPSEWRIS